MGFAHESPPKIIVIFRPCADVAIAVREPVKRRPLVAASFLSLVWKLSLFFATPFVVHSASASPTSDMFSYTGSLNTARYVHTATLLPNGKVLVAGGVGNSGSPPSGAD